MPAREAMCALGLQHQQRADSGPAAQFMVSINNLAVWISLPLSEQPMAEGQLPLDPWAVWTRLRVLSEHHSQLGVMLTVPASLPEGQAWRSWAGEPVKALLLPTSIFLTNKRGYPTLSKPHQALLAAFFELGVQVGVTGLMHLWHVPLGSLLHAGQLMQLLTSMRGRA